MSTIYLVTDNVDYEGYGIIKAFTNKDDAVKLRDECDQYDKTRVGSPAYKDSDEAWEDWSLKDEEWQDKHPSGSYTSADSYNVIETELD